MAKVLNNFMCYRRYCWNQGLELWNGLYEQRVEMIPASLRKKSQLAIKDKTIVFLTKNKNCWMRFHHHLIILFEI